MSRDQLLAALRPRAFAIAYRMLGSVSEAEDVVQEALLRLHDAQERGEQIASPPAYLATVVTRLAIDELRSARARREVYVGEWLPEPLVTDTSAHDPERDVELAESITMAFLTLLETLGPEQRAAFLLREVFDYEYAAIAAILGKNEAAVRQLVTRARRRVARDRGTEYLPRAAEARAAAEALARRFFSAWQAGDKHAIESLLAEDVALYGDGGGKVPALARSLHGRERVAHTLTTWSRAGERIDGLAVRVATINGEPGALTLDGHGRVISVVTLQIDDRRIRAIRSVVNPDKLSHLGEVADYVRLLRGS